MHNRINASDLLGKKMLKYEDKINNRKTMQLLPNNVGEVLQFTNYEEEKDKTPSHAVSSISSVVISIIAYRTAC